MHAGANLSLLHNFAALSSDITIAALKRSHEIATCTYLKKAFHGHFFHANHDFPEQLNAQQSCEL